MEILKWYALPRNFNVLGLMRLNIQTDVAEGAQADLAKWIKIGDHLMNLESMPVEGRPWATVKDMLKRASSGTTVTNPRVCTHRVA